MWGLHVTCCIQKAGRWVTLCTWSSLPGIILPGSWGGEMKKDSDGRAQPSHCRRLTPPPPLVLASGSWNNYIVYQHIFLLLTYRSAARLSDVQLKTVTWNLDKVPHYSWIQIHPTPPHTPPGLWSYAPWCAITSGLRGSCKLEDKSTTGLDFRPTNFHGF